MNICFIADFFANDIPGGGDLNNEEVIKIATGRGLHIKKVKSINASVKYLESLVGFTFIIANFVHLPRETINFLLDKKYVIYEHDHKYIAGRNPAKFKNFKAPDDKIINREFYERASAIFCQSKFHKNIVEKNLHLENIISLSGNLWSEDVLRLIDRCSRSEKMPRCAIMNSAEPHKNTKDAIKYCNLKKMQCML